MEPVGPFIKIKTLEGELYVCPQDGGARELARTYYSYESRCGSKVKSEPIFLCVNVYGKMHYAKMEVSELIKAIKQALTGEEDMEK